MTLTLVRSSLGGKQFSGSSLVGEYSLWFVHSPFICLSFVSFSIRELGFVTSENTDFGLFHLEGACTRVHLAVSQIDGDSRQL